MNHLSRSLIIFGFILALAGILVQFLGKIPGVGRLPGDILVKKGPVTFYFPLATSLMVSLLLSLFLTLFLKR